MLEKCPGIYCGRVDYGEYWKWIQKHNKRLKFNSFPGNFNFSSCGACPRGSRVDPMKDYICKPCDKPLSSDDWLYLGFMSILPLIFHWFSINNSAKQRRFTKEEIILHTSAFIEVGISAFLTILLTEPKWSLEIHSCGVRNFSDFYTLFYNPSPHYEKTLICTQEAVFPLQTMVLIFYLFCVTFMMIIRPSLNAKYMPNHGKMAIYYALYIFPILSMIHAVGSGFICKLLDRIRIRFCTWTCNELNLISDYSFPYLSILLSVVNNANHFSIKLDQSMKSLVISSVTEIRNVIIIREYLHLILCIKFWFYLMCFFSWTLDFAGLWNCFHQIHVSLMFSSPSIHVLYINCSIH